jgi:hypothetical protein
MVRDRDCFMHGVRTMNNEEAAPPPSNDNEMIYIYGTETCASHNCNEDAGNNQLRRNVLLDSK